MKKLIIAILIGLPFLAQSQDAQFTQFYAAPLYHNPAFAGSGYAPRLMFNYRNQWPSLNANFTTSLFSFDHFFEKINSGVGIMVMNDNQGNRIKNTEITGLYSYQLQLSDEKFLRFGLNTTVSDRGLDGNGLIFGDQLEEYIKNGTLPASKDPLLNTFNNVRLFDIGGGLLYFSPKVYFGASVKHINQPAVRYSTLSDVTLSKLPMTILLNTGYNFRIGDVINGTNDKEIVVTPTLLYKKQNSFSQLDIGVYATYAPMTVGLFYRGIPLKGVTTKFPNQDAISGLIGYRMDNFSIGYSYDLTISGLGMNSGGSHEFSVSYIFNKAEHEKSPYQRNKQKRLACPKF